ncbi:hypothetical protein ACCS33_10665 [Rhizobium ruizarguesonis]|nr:hypothetical protein [Rhizobium leguminosarum bv. viciae]
MQDDHNQNRSNDASGSVSRRVLLRSVAASAAIAVPVAAPAAEVEKPLEKLCRLGHEMGAALDEYQDGSFDAIITPARFNKEPLDLRKRPETLSDEITFYVVALKAVLARMHPAAKVSANRCWHEGKDDVDIIFSVRHPSTGGASDEA